MSNNNQRLLQIDVLRGVAALGVFLFHVAMSLDFPKRTLPTINLFGEIWPNIPSVLSFGATGVNLFFVISGFCLALQPLRRNVTAIEIRPYVRQRLSRIYPAYFLAILFSVFVANIRGIEWSLYDVFSKFFFLQGFIQKWNLTLNGALWSMSTEAQFYAAFPLIFIALTRFSPPAFLVSIFIAVIIFRVICAMMPSSEVVIGGIVTGTFLMNTLLGRLVEFSLGMWLAKEWLNQPIRLARLCRLVLWPAVALGLISRMGGPGWLADPALALMYAALVGFVVTRSFRVDDRSLAAAFGRASYSFFLLHIPVICLIEYGGIVPDGLSLYEKFFLVAGLGFLATLLLSSLLYLCVEIPCVEYFKNGKYAKSREVLLGSEVGR
jgi:peptidoglycan/LPS O-acetylase OafA/YrhL